MKYFNETQQEYKERIVRKYAREIFFAKEFLGEKMDNQINWKEAEEYFDREVK